MVGCHFSYIVFLFALLPIYSLKKVIQKDLLDVFIKEKGMKLIWTLNSSKEIYTFDLSVSQWSDWTGLLSHDKANIKGNVYRVMTQV